MERTRVVSVSFLNAAPLTEGLAGVEGVDLQTAVPSRIAGMLERQEADVGLVSVVDAQRSPVPLALLPVGGIGCRGPTLTVRLFSAVPPERITTLHADTDSNTSVALARVLLSETHGVRPDVVDFDARERTPAASEAGPNEAWPETLLLIGDKVVTDSPPAVRYPYQIDLGEQWFERTGLPFVYAAWACRAADATTPRVRTAAALLDRTRRRNTHRLDWLVTRHAERGDWPADLARRYVGELLRYEIDADARAGVAAFAERASAMGLCARREPIWADPEPAETD